MNTMADGAAQRLVAQIGEALFGQPGLTLMELAEKVKGVSGGHGNVLSAQPSPAGQDALQLANEWRHVFDGDGHDMAGANKNTLRRFIQAIEVLAARQPVGEPVADAGRSAAYDAIDRFLRNNMDDEAYAAYVEHLEALWAAVPAQAVDLGQFRPAVCAMGLYAEEPEDVDEARRLLALIDSQAVGNG